MLCNWIVKKKNCHIQIQFLRNWKFEFNTHFSPPTGIARPTSESRHLRRLPSAPKPVTVVLLPLRYNVYMNVYSLPSSRVVYCAGSINLLVFVDRAYKSCGSYTYIYLT